ncbi:hypothetical protein KR222_011253 [Zaprionus bogoriensis]|nr:hypothetical protein KR222_011253 [Zaprionus bogoriensis]
MDDEDLSIISSPTPTAANFTRRSQRLRRCATTRKRRDNVSGEQARAAQHNETKNNLSSRFELHEEQLYEADRLDCLRAQQEPRRARAVPASENFMSLQCLLESQQLPAGITEAEAADSYSPPLSPALASTVPSIVQQILCDFCDELQEQEQESPNYDWPWFRFRGMEIRTYCRKVRTQAAATTDDEDRMSCSSGLSVQEDYVTQVPMTTHCSFDANSSQKICENLLNLSAFFTQQNNANSSIDLPADLEQDEDAMDILDENGYLVGNTEELMLQYAPCDTKTEGI